MYDQVQSRVLYGLKLLLFQNKQKSQKLQINVCIAGDGGVLLESLSEYAACEPLLPSLYTFVAPFEPSVSWQGSAAACHFPWHTRGLKCLSCVFGPSEQSPRLLQACVRWERAHGARQYPGSLC